MRKEVNRSLLMWPAATSAAILALTCFPVAYEVDLVVPQAPVTPQIVTIPRMAKPLTSAPELDTPEVDFAARREHGSRAMPLPERVAEVFGVPGRMVKAPIRDEGNELAGLGGLPDSRSHQGIDPETVDDLLRELAMVAAAAASEPSTPSSNALLSVSTLPSLRKPATIDPAPVEMDEMTPSWLVGPGRPEFWEPNIRLVQGGKFTPSSILPKSTRVLGRRELTLVAEPPVTLMRNHHADNSSNAINRVVDESQADESQADESQSEGSEQEEAVVAAVVDSVVQDLEPESPSAMLANQWLVGDRPRLAQAPPEDDKPKVTSRVERPRDDDRDFDQRSPAGWPVTKQLSLQLEALAGMAQPNVGSDAQRFVSTAETDQEMLRWSGEVSERLLALQALPRLGDPRAGELIGELDSLASRGRTQAEQLENRSQQVQWLRTSHAVSRRVAVWRPIWELSQPDRPGWGDAELPSSIGVMVEQVRIDLEQTGDVAGWNLFLMLDEIQKAAKRSDPEPRAVLAQRFLSRLKWHQLNDEQLRWLQRESVTELAAAIRPWTQKAIDYADLMVQIEQQEANAIDLAAIDIASAAQTLRFAESPEAVEVATGIDTYYRNANVRVAISKSMMERVLPVIEPRATPVNTRMLGSRVRGVSRIESGIALELIPSPDRWKLALRTTGRVSTHTTGVRGAVSVRTVGASRFDAATPIEVTTRGVCIGDSQADVTGRTRLRGIHSDYDGWPLVGALVRSIAEDRYESMAGTAERLSNREVRNRVELEIDERLQQQVDEAAAKLSEMVLGPLGRLRLDPQVTDMQTTDKRLVARYRVAGDWQLAASTPRPRALSSSLMSVQVHQSAFNNTFEQLVRSDAPVSLREMIQNGVATFGYSDFEMPDDIPEDVTIQFARTRPITIEIQDGRLWVTLRVLRLTRGERHELTQFIVRAAYRPVLDGMQATLVRDDHLRISGPRMSMRERLPVRAIFNKVLSPNRPIVLTAPRLTEHPGVKGLAISQLELRNGWIAMSVSEENAPRIALAD